VTTAIASIGAFLPEEKGVEETLTELCKYGNPKLSKMKRGWYAHIDVFVTGKGVGFEVASDFGMGTQRQALTMCYDRLVKALQKIKETT